MPLRAAVIGTGAIAHQHLRALKSVPDARVVAVCDRSEATAAAFAERHGVARAYVDLVRLLDAEHPDIVHVTTPPASHAAIASAAIDAGAHVIVEKPVVVDPADWCDLRRRAETAGRWVVADHTFCFDPRVTAVVDQIESGLFGEVSAVDVSFAQAIAGPEHPFADTSMRHPALDLPGGPIFDFLPHLASLAVMFVGAPRHVEAWWRPADRALPLPYDHVAALVAGDRTVARLSFDALASPEGFRVAVSGARARATLDLYEGRLSVARNWAGMPSPLHPLINAGLDAWSSVTAVTYSFTNKLLGRLVSYDGLRKLVAATYSAACTGGLPPVSHEDIERVVALVDRLVAPVRHLPPA